MIQFAIAILLFLGTQQDQVVIEADIGPEKNGDIISASGNVTASYQDIHVQADTLTFNEATNILTADGSVRFTRAQEHFEADRVTINLTTKVSDLTNVRGEVGPGFFVTAVEAHRSEDGSYELKTATLSTCCDMPRPGWTLALARAVVEPNKRVTAKNSLFKLESVPIFYLPYVMVPTADRSRATGFLIPSTSFSSIKGRSVRESFFWAINRSADATFTGEYFSKRGPAGAIEFRAVPDANSAIRVETVFATQRSGITPEEALKEPGGQSARILAFGNLGRGFRGAADMNLVSSLVFRQAFEEGFNIISSPLEHSLAFLSRNRPDMSINMLYGRYGVFFTDQPTVVTRKFPAFEVSLPDRSVGRFPIYFSADTSLAGVARRDAAIKTPASVHRFDFHPAVEIPLVRSGVFSWSHRIGVRETVYTHSRRPQVVSDALNRLSFDYTSSFAGPQFERDFAGWRHVVEPSVDYRYINGADRFRQTIVVDDVDLVTDTNEVEYAVTNRFFTTREIFSWRLSQKYFFDPTFGGAIIPGRRNVLTPLLGISGFAFADGARRFSPIVSTMRLSMSAATSADLQIDYDTRDRLFRSAGLIAGVNRGPILGSLSYFFTRRSAIQIPNNQIRGTVGYGNGLKPGFSGAFAFSYDIERSLFQGSAAQVGYNTNCYGLSFELSTVDIGARKETNFRFAFTLKDIGSIGTLGRQERLF